jgi:hypothetical protein
MHKTTLTFVLFSAVFFGFSSGAFAQCDTTNTSAVDGSRLEGNLVCAFKGAGGPNERWSEMHYDGGPSINGGTLGEWGRGSDDPAGSYDADVGSWSFSGNTITYNYDSTYVWTLYGPDSTTPTVFCNGGTLVATITQANAIPTDTTLSNPCSW